MDFKYAAVFERASSPAGALKLVTIWFSGGKAPVTRTATSKLLNITRFDGLLANG